MFTYFYCRFYKISQLNWQFNPNTPLPLQNITITSCKKKKDKFSLYWFKIIKPITCCLQYDKDVLSTEANTLESIGLSIFTVTPPYESWTASSIWICWPAFSRTDELVEIGMLLSRIGILSLTWTEGINRRTPQRNLIP